MKSYKENNKIDASLKKLEAFQQASLNVRLPWCFSCVGARLGEIEFFHLKRNLKYG